MSNTNLDTILGDLGNFGRFQKRNYLLISFFVVFSVFQMSYIFTSRSLKHRCLIDECENETSVFMPEWLKDAVPFEGDTPKSCLRYANEENYTVDICSSNTFNKNSTVICNKFLYETEDVTIANDFNIVCEENLWMLTSAGTINNIGELVNLPLAGFISDKYGRRIMMIVSMALATLCGLIRSFTPNYYSFVTMEFLDTALGSGFYSATFILAIELVVPEKRVLGNTIMAIAFAIGEAMLGLLAWATPSWRIFLRVLYAPGALLVIYGWYAPESVRWLLSKGKTQEAQRQLIKVAKVNGRELSDEVLKKLESVESKNEEDIEISIFHVFQSIPLLVRLIICSICWICTTFTYYGLSMQSVLISGNPYVNYIAVAAIEIPAFIVTYFTLDKYGRRLTQSLSLILAGASCIAFIFIDDSNFYVKLIFFLLGKFNITIAYTVLYMYTTELFPTCLRHSSLAVCSMVGRFGSMMAPQVPLLATISKSLPLTLFSIVGFTSGCLTLFFPETHNVKLPDTIEEAVHMSRKSKRHIINNL